LEINVRDPYEGLTPRQARVRRYFVPSPAFPNIVGPAILGAIALVLLLAGTQTPFLAIVGVVVAFFAVKKGLPRITLYLRLKALAEPKPSDEQMDKWLHEALEPAIEQGFTRLDIVRDDLVSKGREPLQVIGLPQNTSYRLATGRDGIVRSSHYDILVVYMTQWHLSTFQCVLDMETGAFVSDQTREFTYRDIVSVSTASDRLVAQFPLDHRKAPGEPGSGQPASGQPGPAGHLKVEATTAQLFSLKVASDEIRVLVSLFDFKVDGRGFDSGVDNALQQIRGRLRAYTTLQESGEGSFEDLHRARQRRGSAWPAAN
jgi:hypothetical protein